MTDVGDDLKIMHNYYNYAQEYIEELKKRVFSHRRMIGLPDIQWLSDPKMRKQASYFTNLHILHVCWNCEKVKNQEKKEVQVYSCSEKPECYGGCQCYQVFDKNDDEFQETVKKILELPQDNIQWIMCCTNMDYISWFPRMECTIRLFLRENETYPLEKNYYAENPILHLPYLCKYEKEREKMNAIIKKIKMIVDEKRKILKLYPIQWFSYWKYQPDVSFLLGSLFNFSDEYITKFVDWINENLTIESIDMHIDNSMKFPITLWISFVCTGPKIEKQPMTLFGDQSLLQPISYMEE